MKKFTILFALITCSFKLTQAQCIYTIAGDGYSGSIADSIRATSANILYCFGVAVDSNGYVYVSAAQDDMVEKVSKTGNIYYVAGTGSVGPLNDGGPATAANISSPHGVAVDPRGNIYICDLGDERIRVVNKSGIINTYAGTGSTTYNGDGIAATAANLNNPYGVAVDDSGNVYIAENGNQRIRKVSYLTGKISTIAGNGTAGSTGDGGLATSAEVNYPADVKVDGTYNVYFSENAGQRIRKITHSTGKISTIGGTGSPGNTGDGGNATAATINAPEGIAVDKSGNVYIADWNNSRVREIVASTAKMEAFGGTGSVGYTGDNGPATAATMDQPTGVAVDANGDVFVADFYNSRIREITSASPKMPWSVTSSSDLSICAGMSTTLHMRNTRGVMCWYNGTTFITHADSLVTGPLYSTTSYSIDDSSECGTSLKYTLTVTVNPQPYAYVHAHDTICQGLTDTMVIKFGSAGTAPYTYTWTYINQDSTDHYTDTAYGDTLIVTAPPISEAYLFTIVDSKGCVDTGRNDIKVLPAEVTTSTVPSIYCGATSVGFNAVFNPTSPTSFTWAPSTGLSSTATANPKADPNTTTTYTITAHLKNGCIATDTVTVKVNPATVTVRDTSVFCGKSVNLNPVCVPASPASASWSPATYLSNAAILTPTCTPSSETTYTITTTYANGCTAKDTMTVFDAVPDSFGICSVSVDTSSLHNIIVWDKTGLSHIDSFKVYYMNSSSVWQLIKAVPFNAPAYLVDSTPINNPNANTVRYCLTVVDSCGHEEHFSTSLWQNTTFIVGNGTGTFDWAGTAYLVEGKAQPVQTYVLQRDTLSDGHWQGIDSVPGNQYQMTDPNYSKYPFSRYRVLAELYNGCAAPDLRPYHAAATSSRSNTSHNITVTGIRQLVNNESISVFPNPASQTLNIKFALAKATDADIKVVDVMGRVVIESQNNVKADGNIQLDIANLTTGVYFVKVSTSNSSMVQKFVKE